MGESLWITGSQKSPWEGGSVLVLPYEISWTSYPECSGPF